KWILHVDWFTFDPDASEDRMIPLRVYVGSNDDRIFDFTGFYNIGRYNETIIEPLALQRGRGNGMVRTRFYYEQQLKTFPLRVEPKEKDIVKARQAIFNNMGFLQEIPKRQNLHIPAYIAAQYTYGRCAAYAQALEDLLGVKATAIISKKFKEDGEFGSNKPGYVHSFVLHPNGEGEDVWGIQPLQKIIDRFGIEEYTLCQDTHKEVNQNLRTNSTEIYDKYYDIAVEMIKLGQ